MANSNKITGSVVINSLYLQYLQHNKKQQQQQQDYPGATLARGDSLISFYCRLLNLVSKSSKNGLPCNAGVWVQNGFPSYTLSMLRATVRFADEPFEVNDGCPHS